MARFDLTDFEWSQIEPLLPYEPRGVPCVDDRHVLNGIFPAFADRSALGGHSRPVRPLHHVREPHQPLAKGR